MISSVTVKRMRHPLLMLLLRFCSYFLFFCVVVVVVDDDDDDDLFCCCCFVCLCRAPHLKKSAKRFTVAALVPFSASEQTHCVQVVCDFE